MEFCTACTYSPECITCALEKRILDLTARCEEMAAEIAVLRTKVYVVDMDEADEEEEDVVVNIKEDSENE
jgi:hypothetical protein